MGERRLSDNGNIIAGRLCRRITQSIIMCGALTLIVIRLLHSPTMIFPLPPGRWFLVQRLRLASVAFFFDRGKGSSIRDPCRLRPRTHKNADILSTLCKHATYLALYSVLVSLEINMGFTRRGYGRRRCEV